MRRLALSVLLALSLAGPAAAQGVQADPDLKTRLDAVIDRAVAEERVVGTVVLVARDGEVVYRRAAGFADREAKLPMREDAQFRFSSVTKPIVSAAAMALVEQGRLGMDDPVTRWLPDFRPKLADGREPAITVRQLMSHTAGLTYGFFEQAGHPYHKAGVSDGFDDVRVSLEENLRRLAAQPLAYEPGKGWGYSLATDVLGAVIAKAAGKPLPDAVEALVTGPLGLKDTGFIARDPQRLATAYADGKPQPVRMADPQPVPFGPGTLRFSPGRAFDPAAYPSGGAGMVGTAPDVLRFLEALRRGGAPVLSPKGVETMLANAVGDLPTAILAPGWRFGLAVSVLSDPAPSGTPQSAGTWQWGGVYGHSWFVDPAQRLTVVAFTNTAIEGMAGAFPTAIRDAVYGKS